MDEQLERRLAALEERVEFLMQHQHVGGQYSKPVHIHLKPDRVMWHKSDVIIEQGDLLSPIEEQEQA